MAEWGSLLVVVPKRDSSIPIAVKYRLLNADSLVGSGLYLGLTKT